MTWQFSTPNIAVTTNARDAKNSIAPFAPITQVGTTTRAGTASNLTGGSITCSYPAGITSGDLIFVVCQGKNSNSLPQTPSGYTLFNTLGFGTDSMHRIFWKIATGAEGASLAVTYSPYGGTGSLACVTITVCRGVNTTTPIATTGSAFQPGTGGTAFGPISGGVITGGSGALVHCIGYDFSALATWPTSVSNNGLTFNKLVEMDPYELGATNSGGSALYLAINPSQTPVTLTTGPTFTLSAGSASAARYGIVSLIQTANP